MQPANAPLPSEVDSVELEVWRGTVSGPLTPSAPKKMKELFPVKKERDRGRSGSLRAQGTGV